jgi:hypothetical protein
VKRCASRDRMDATGDALSRACCGGYLVLPSNAVVRVGGYPEF